MTQAPARISTLSQALERLDGFDGGLRSYLDACQVAIRHLAELPYRVIIQMPYPSREVKDTPWENVAAATQPACECGHGRWLDPGKPLELRPGERETYALKPGKAFRFGPAGAPTSSAFATVSLSTQGDRLTVAQRNDTGLPASSLGCSWSPGYMLSSFGRVVVPDDGHLTDSRSRLAHQVMPLQEQLRSASGVTFAMLTHVDTGKQEIMLTPATGVEVTDLSF